MSVRLHRAYTEEEKTKLQSAIDEAMTINAKAATEMYTRVWGTSPTHYILNKQHEAVPVHPDMWGYWRNQDFEGHCRVAKDVVGLYEISTVFIGLATSDPPDLFETRVLNLKSEEELLRVATKTWDAAVEYHGICVRVADGPKADPNPPQS